MDLQATLANSLTEDKVQPPTAKEDNVSHCSLMTSQGNNRANGISERGSNNQSDCEDDQGVGHTSTEFLVSIGPSRVPTAVAQAVRCRRRRQPRRPPQAKINPGNPAPAMEREHLERQAVRASRRQYHR
jgi:hypothetical protein